MMMFVQKSIEIEGRIIGWGYLQCTFIDNYLQTGVHNQCVNLLHSIDTMNNQPIYVHKKVQTQFTINGDLSNLILGVEMNIYSETHNIVVGYNIVETCDPATSYPSPNNANIMSQNKSVIVKYMPNWNETDGYVNCEETWVYEKQAVCASIWILNEKINPNSVVDHTNQIPLVSLNIRTIEISYEERNRWKYVILP